MWITLTRAALPVVLALTPHTAVAAASAAPAARGDIPAARAAEPGADVALTVSPDRIVVRADQVDRPRRFTVTNSGRQHLDVRVSASGFSAGPDGTLRLHADAPYSAAGWVTVKPDRFRLPAGKAKRLDLTIVVPEDAEPGEHQVAVLFSVAAPKHAAGIGVIRSVGAPVYVSTPGRIVDSIDLTGLRAPGFTLGGPVEIGATVRNTGSRHRDFVGDDRLHARVGGERVPFPEFTLLRDGSQRISTRWTGTPLLCVCRATLTVPNPDGTSRSAATTVVILPLHLIAPALLLLLALPALGWLLRRHLRHRRTTGARPTLVGDGHA